jgi:hypothetical protein
VSDEPFISRWSRRKRDAESEAKAAPAAAPAENAAELPPNANDASDAPQPSPAPPPVPTDPPAFDLSSLPPIESITAETDIRAFLAPGVPEETARAALRRAWSADPAIRDFVGLAEYAWDFTKPDSMPGFGPLEMTDTLRRYAAQILGGAKDETTAVDRGETVREVTDAEKNAAASDASTAEAAARGASSDSSAANSGAATTQGSENVIVDTADAAAQHEPRDLQHAKQDSPLIGRRAHGGALPE